MPDWLAVIDGYCERTDATFWSEPLNAISNVSFLIAAALAWRVGRNSSDRATQILGVGAASIGVGSFLFHTYANVWSLQADVYPIRIFVLAFVGLATVRFFKLPWWAGVVSSAGFLLFSIAATRLTAIAVGHLNGSVGYVAVPLALAAVAALLFRRSPITSKGLAVAAAVFSVSLALRTIDIEVCPAMPVGTHFIWHVLNGAAIGWIILVFARSKRDGSQSKPN